MCLCLSVSILNVCFVTQNQNNNYITFKRIKISRSVSRITRNRVTCAGVQVGGSPGEKGAGGVRETGEEGAGSRRNTEGEITERCAIFCN